MIKVASNISILWYINIPIQRNWGHHNKPHIHAKYNEYEISIDFEGIALGGIFPSKQKKILDAWIEIHKDELNAEWYSYNNEGEIIKIKGLE